MKIILVLVLCTLSSTVFASEKLCEYLQKNTFESFSSKLIHDKEKGTDKETKKLVIENTSKDLLEKVKQQCKEGNLFAVKDYDSCSSKCYQYGTRVNYGKMILDYIPKPTPVTVECQKLCKAYQLYAFAFEDGQRSEVSEHSTAEGTHKCGAHVNDQEFGTHKSDLVEKVKQQVKIESQASGQ